MEFGVYVQAVSVGFEELWTWYNYLWLKLLNTLFKISQLIGANFELNCMQT